MNTTTNITDLELICDTCGVTVESLSRWPYVEWPVHCHTFMRLRNRTDREGNPA